MMVAMVRLSTSIMPSRLRPDSSFWLLAFYALALLLFLLPFEAALGSQLPSEEGSSSSSSSATASFRSSSGEVFFALRDLASQFGRSFADQTRYWRKAMTQAFGPASLAKLLNPSSASLEPEEEQQSGEEIEIGAFPRTDRFRLSLSNIGGASKAGDNASESRRKGREKREVGDEYQSKNCSGVGRPVVGDSATNICSTGCKAQLDCNSTVGFKNPFALNETIARCRVRTVTCGSTILRYVYEAFPVMMSCPDGLQQPTSENVETCDIAQLLYQGSLLNFTSTPELTCIVDHLYCDGKKIPFSHSSTTYQPKPGENCTVVSRSCKTEEYCVSIEKLCERNGECYFVSFPCEDACWPQRCICPIDYSGDACSEKRPFKCSLSMITPVPQCEVVDPGSLLDSDPVCFKFSITQTADFTFNVSCKFDDTSIPTESSDYPFSYWVRVGNTFAISQKAFRPVSMFLKAFNMLFLSDSSATFFSPGSLVGEQLTGQELIQVTADFSMLQSLPQWRRFFAGGRTYAEVGLNATLAGIQVPVSRRLLLDWVDLPPPTEPPASYYVSNGNAVAFGIIAALLGVSLLGWLTGETLKFLRGTKKMIERTKGKKLQ